MKKILYCLALFTPLACAETVKQDDNGSSTGGTSNTSPEGSGGQSNTGGATTLATEPAVTGGSTGNGGSVATGGTMTTGGNTNVVVTACGLPVAGTNNVAKPAGTPGNLKILNWAGFTGAVSYTFDDANTSQIAHYAELQALGVRMTFYIQTGKASATNDIWKQAVLDGHELGNHTQTHTQTGTAADVDAATAFLQTQYGVKAVTMAAPYGDSSYVALAETRFLINRGVSNALIAPNGSNSPFNLPCYIPPAGALASAFNSQVDTAVTGGGWRVMLVHGFTGGTDSAYQPVDIGEFTSHVTYAKSLGKLWIDSVVNVGAYWRAQKLISAVTPSKSGNDSTWTWALPANFPPGKCLRVAVDGGTLLQGGKALDWDKNGYYEVALDAGSLTLTP